METNVTNRGLGALVDKQGNCRAARFRPARDPQVDPRNKEKKTVTIFDALFGCWHKRTSFPQASRRGLRRSGASAQRGTYVVCLDCGKEFAYDWQKMRIVHSRKDEETYASTAVEAKAV
jgi:hypothetical protein